ncbi:probable inactive receptor-like protein kinase At3g56050 [Rhodamnia argentea]|uniref:Probable inactive receptor-like protein kinase At3g56050 n=1 Tax=Rhodamnia argentea TaxID=178133 RepID=A0A8B8PHP5_9MYRT|nr:probable inactive receptor-like protein kinase At3g56050 [Rhodamnia argentea]
MKHGRQSNRLKDRIGVGFLLMISLFFQHLGICRCLNEEGLALLRVRDKVVSDPFGALRNWNENDGEIDPCSWFGVECSDGKVVVLNLKDLCLGGTLAPEMGNLVHIRAIILRNNTFSGVIPEEFGVLKELEVLDLGYNNFSGPLPYKLGNNFSLAILLVDNNELLTASSPEMREFALASESQVDENHLSIAANKLACKMRCNAWKEEQTSNAIHSRVLAVTAERPATIPRGPPSRGPPQQISVRLPPPTPPSPSPAPTLAPAPVPVPVPTSSAPPPPELTNTPPRPHTKSSHQAIMGGAVGGSVFIFITILGIYLCRSNKVATVKPWATGLSGQLQKAFVTGVPKLKRAEVEAACEDFSNVVGSSSIGTIYKGTLSSGVEIAVASVAVKSAKGWSKNLEAQFRNMIGTLSKVNHKNFINLLGYCEEEEPFTRMMVFEYSPNGTLFEHLHIKESEHLDWRMRLRIAMGMAYCLEHMHSMNPPMVHKNLNSSAVTLTEDYAAKICDFNFWNQMAAAEIEQSGIGLLNTASTSRRPESNVYSFGVILFEMVTGRLPYSVDDGSVEDWASDYLRGEQPLREMVDPSLDSCQEEQVDRIGQLIKSCVHPDPRVRPAMREVAAMLLDITGITRDGAIPKISPLWWAELEVLSTDAN